MKSGTRLLLATLAMLLWAAPAWAQKNVTFQVDLNALSDACQFNPAIDRVFMPGSINGWDTAQGELKDADGDGIYTNTLSLAEGTEVSFKFYPSTLGWEDDPNGTYTVTADADQMVPVATYRKQYASACAPAGQSLVTFQVDMGPAMAACQFNPVRDSVFVRGSLNEWGLTSRARDANMDSIYTYTDTLDVGSTVTWKFWATGGWGSGDAAYEGDPNRSYAVVDMPQQAIPVVPIRKTFTDICGAARTVYDVEFQVDMSVAKLSPAFNPEEGDLVTVSGNFNGWNTTADTLQPGFLEPNLYTGIIQTDTIATPYELLYKFVIHEGNGGATEAYESVPNRSFVLTGDDSDTDGNGALDVTVPSTYFNNVTPDQVFTEDVLVTYEVDLRPAYYYFKDNNDLPRDTQTGEPVAALTGVWINGPVIGASDGLADWAGWGPESLGSLETRQLVDDGSKGDVTANDSVFTITLAYPAGTPRQLSGKFGASSYDNEGGFGADHVFMLAADTTILRAFGVPRLVDGRYTDARGPASFEHAYDPYVVISSDSMSYYVVRSGGMATANENGSELPEVVSLQQNYPNPFSGRTTFTYTLDATQQVSLRVFDITGRQVAVLVDGVQSPAQYDVAFEAGSLPSGVYMYQLRTASGSITKQMVLVK